MNASEAECIFGHELTAHRRLCLAGGVRLSERKGEARRFAGGKGARRKRKDRRFSNENACLFGANSRIRTGDLLITNQLLYQLSHISNRNLLNHYSKS